MQLTLDSSVVEAKARAWRDADPDRQTRAELTALLRKKAMAELGARFSGPLEFGTAGLRGVLGAGESRMNQAVVVLTTAGLCDVLAKQIEGSKKRGIVIGHDARRRSRALAEAAAQIAAARGFRVWLFSEPEPTPLVAFALKHVKAAAAIVVTASHNPPEYNGYKVYWENGAQIIAPIDRLVREAAEGYGAVGARALLLEAQESRKRPASAPRKWKHDYLRAALALRRQPKLALSALTVAYTPLHGVGGALVKELLRRGGVRKLHVVAKQFAPDGRFPTVRFPNPEEPGAMDLLLALGRAKKADVLIANDPDADRFAAAVADGQGGFRVLTGNEVGTALGAYLLAHAGRGKRPLVSASVVSSTQLGAIAARRGAVYQETLTGFKWIANAAMAREKLARQANEPVRFVFGYEEALGYTAGTVVRDKDGISTALLFCELMAWLRRDKRSFADFELELAREVGAFVSRQKSVDVPGAAGQARVSSAMSSLRASPPAMLGDRRITKVKDYAQGTDLPPANLVALELAGGGRVLLRPSGTEPKFKIYFEVSEALPQGADLAALEAARGRGARAIDALQTSLLAYLGWA